MSGSAGPREGDRLLRLGISACLLGEQVRWDGGHRRDRNLLALLDEHVDWVPICPEVEIGLGVPRPTIRLEAREEGTRLIEPKADTDLTDTMRSWADGWLEGVEDQVGRLHGFILKRGSPSCGPENLRIYQGDTLRRTDGTGVFAERLRGAFPHLPIMDEGRLSAPSQREHFLDHAMALRRWTDLLQDGPGVHDLVQWHGRNKFTLLAHSPQGQRDLGRLVANASDHPLPEVLERYERGLAEVMAEPATRQRHTNVLQHVQGFLKDDLDRADTEELDQAIQDHHDGIVPLLVPLTLLRHHLRRADAPAWVREQTYLDPYPKEWMLRAHL